MVTKNAYAKINLGLRILNKRGDGFHEIETIFHRVNIFDTISLEQSNTISLVSSEKSLPCDISNLCVKAATKLQERYCVQEGVKIILQKNIPIGAGLGGGSADAVATLLGLMELWNLSLSDGELQRAAAELGSDVPYFLKSGSAYATGRGELLNYFHLDIPYWIVVVYPNIDVSTSWAYSQCRISEPKSRINLQNVLASSVGSLTQLNQVLTNDFEEIVIPKFPMIGEVKERLLEAGAGVAKMSGSGSSVYAFFQSEEQAQSAAMRMDAEFRVFLTPPHFHPNDL